MSQAQYTPIQKQHITWNAPKVLILLLSVIFIFFISERFVNSPIFRVQEVTFTGQRHVSSLVIRHLSDIRYKEHLLFIKTTEAEYKIQQHPWIKEAKISRFFPSSVNIEVEEYQPVIVLAMENLWYVDYEGDIFRKADSNNLDYPILTGVPNSWISQHPELLFKTIEEALEIYNACKVPLIGSVESVSEINFHPNTGFRVILRNGTILSLGFFDPYDRITRLRKMIAKGLDISIPQQIELDADKVAIAKPLTKLINE
jgi:cell division protein FtsQ